MQRNILTRAGHLVCRSCSPHASQIKCPHSTTTATARILSSAHSAHHLNLTQRRKASLQSRSVSGNTHILNQSAVSDLSHTEPILPSTDTASVASQDPFALVENDLATMIDDIHRELEHQIAIDSELIEMAKYYFDGAGKGLRPVVAMCIGHAYNHHMAQGTNIDHVINNQRMVAMVSEMIHTASLVHDDILDQAETRRGKASVNSRWDLTKSTMCGDYVLAVASKLLAQIGHQEVIIILSKVLTDLVQGEFMQLQTKEEENERFQHYLTKSFNKTASLMAYSCKANALLSGANPRDIESAFSYGRNIGIAFQLVDDLLDFVSSADLLGKPAAADLHLGLATAPVLFATAKFPQLNDMIARRFSQEGDVETAFECVLSSDGLEETRALARKHCNAAVAALENIAESSYKAALIGLCEKVLNRIK